MSSINLPQRAIIMEFAASPGVVYTARIPATHFRKLEISLNDFVYAPGRRLVDSDSDTIPPYIIDMQSLPLGRTSSVMSSLSH